MTFQTILQKIHKIQFRLFFIELSALILVAILFIYQWAFNVTETTKYYNIFECVKDALIVMNGFFGIALLTVNHIEKEIINEMKKIKLMEDESN